MNSKKLLIIVPAYNEQENIRRTLREIKDFLRSDEFRFKNINAQIVVVDDGSRDLTRQSAQDENVTVLSLPFNLGIGGAVQTGIQFARINDFDLACQVDADGQHDIHFLNQLVEPLLTDQAVFTIGSRFLPPHTGYRSSFIRRIGINFFAQLISALTGQKVTDPTSGFRVFDKELIDVFSEYYPSDFPEPEAIMIAGRHGFKVKEVPVVMRKRFSGTSSIRYLKTFYYMVKVTIALLLDKIKSVRKRGT